MTNSVPDILTRIVEHKKQELAASSVPLATLEAQAESRVRERRDFRAALLSKNPAIISEIKKASPSKGLLSQNFQPVETAAAYEDGGAAAISVLTDERFFQGSFDHLEAVRARVRLPVIRKDFTTDSYHVVEAAAHGADAILLIAAILTERQMRDYRELAARFQMSALVEVHDASELNAALASGAEIIGVNNRNLHTFEVSLDTSLRLADRIPDTAVKVSESGIHGRADIDRLRGAGFQAFLIGEHLMRSGDPRAALRGLLA